MPGKGSCRRASRTFAGASAAFLAAALALVPGNVVAQCIVTGTPVNFEPNPPGPAGPRPILLSGGYSYNHALYQNGAGGAWRILLQESYGYSVLDLTNPASPSVIKWDDFRFDSPPIEAHGDGQSYIATVAASPDGQRVALGTFGQTEPNWNTLVASPDGGSGFVVRGDTYPVRAQGTVIHAVAGRYLHYAVTGGGVSVSDITSLPGAPASHNVASAVTGWPGGAALKRAGNYLIYLAADGSVQIVDAARPGPVGSIANGMPRTSLVPANFSGRSIASAVGTVDVLGRLWILVELFAPTGENSPSYGLVSFTQDGSHNFSAPVSAGPLYRIPAAAGETWAASGGSSALASMNGSVFVFLWGSRRSSFPYLNILYSTTTAGWPTLTPNVMTNASLTILGQLSILQGSSSTAWGYMSAGLYAWVLPMTCQDPNAPAIVSVTAKNAATAADVNDGDTLPFGETLNLTPQVLPVPSGGRTDLTGFRWNSDLDFHAGNPVEDFGAAAAPRLANPDDATFGSPSSPPGTFTLVGPCDPMAGGTPATGVGCWTSVRTNTAQGGPDFSGSETSASPPKPLVVAFEANNSNGSAGPRLFTIKWKVPSVSIASTQLLYGDALGAVAEGHSTSGGANVWKWWLGPSPAALVLAPGCASATCTPSGADAAPGAHSYWVTAPYAQIGYSTPAYAGVAAMGTYTITAFSPSFTVNNVGSAGSLSASSTQALTVANSSRRGSTTTGNGGYAYCIVPASPGTCAAGSWHAFPSLTDPASASAGTPPTFDQVPNPGFGNWVLRIRVTYSNPAGVAYWPDPTGGAGMPVTVFATPSVSASASPNPAESGDNVTFTCSGTGGTGSFAYDWSGQFGTVSSSPAFSTRVTNRGASDALYSFDCTVTDTSSGATASRTVNLTVHPAPPLVASASAGPAIVPAGTPGTFTCSATGGSGGYAYVWDFSDGARVSGAVVPHVFAGYGPSSGTCTVTDSTNAAAQSSASLSVLAAGAGGPYALFTLTPCRLLDTRNAAGGALGAPAIGAAGTQDRSFPVGTACGIPADAKALSVNVTVTNVGATGTLSIYRGDGFRTGTTTTAFTAGRDRANNAMLQLPFDGSGAIKVQNLSPATVDLVVDVNGYYR